jgi:hypothetical protein
MDGNLEQKMDGKLEQMEKNILEALNGRFLKIDDVSKRTHENKGSIQVEQFIIIRIVQGDLTPIMELLMDGLQKE